MLIVDLAPTVSDVARLLRARTKDTVGNELGDFTDETRPTADEVAALIEQARGLVGLSLPADVGDEFVGVATSLIALRAAMLVELTYFPEQVASGRSAYEQYRQMFDDAIVGIRARLPDDTPTARIHSVPLARPAPPPDLDLW